MNNDGDIIPFLNETWQKFILITDDTGKINDLTFLQFKTTYQVFHKFVRIFLNLNK